MEYLFVNPGTLADALLHLHLNETVLDTSGAETLPTYRFRIRHTRDNKDIGFINLRVGSGENLVCYRGHIGYGIEPEHRGHGYAARACLLILPLARRHGINPLWITCNPDNLASRRTCERIGAHLVETITVPENTEAYQAGARVKCRYRLDP